MKRRQKLAPRDGVTTPMELEEGVYPVNEWYAALEGKSQSNSGATVGTIPVRENLFNDAYVSEFSGDFLFDMQVPDKTHTSRIASCMSPIITWLGAIISTVFLIYSGANGQPEKALEISDSPASEVMLCWFEISCVTKCRALIAEGSAGNLQKAAEQLKEYAEMNEGHHNSYHKTEVVALQSVALHKLRQIDEALAALEDA